jgi:hypothetical protein
VTKEIYVSPQELAIIQKIMEENNIKYAVKLIYEDGSGIGSTLDVEFDTEVNGREATIRIPVTGVENW